MTARRARGKAGSAMRTGGSAAQRAQGRGGSRSRLRKLPPPWSRTADTSLKADLLKLPAHIATINEIGMLLGIIPHMPYELDALMERARNARLL